MVKVDLVGRVGSVKVRTNSKGSQFVVYSIAHESNSKTYWYSVFDFTGQDQFINIGDKVHLSCSLNSNVRVLDGVKHYSLMIVFQGVVTCEPPKHLKKPDILDDLPF